MSLRAFLNPTPQRTIATNSVVLARVDCADRWDSRTEYPRLNHIAGLFVGGFKRSNDDDRLAVDSARAFVNHDS